MKRLLLSGGALVALLIGVTAYAADGPTNEEHALHRAERVDHVFEMLDANADGAIDLAEVEAGRGARFAATDSDGDGNLTVTELSAAAEKRASKRIAGVIRRLDGNGDGVIDQSEFDVRSDGHGGRHGAKMFKRFDADGDGRVTRAEADAHVVKRHKRWHDG